MNKTKGILLTAGVLMLVLGSVFVITGYVSGQADMKFFQDKPGDNPILACANGKELTLDEFRTEMGRGRISVSLSANASTRQVTGVLNNNTGCSIPLSLSVYKMFDPLPNIATQRFFSGTAIVSAAPYSTAVLNAPLPACKAQFDFWYGAGPRYLINNYTYQNLITANITSDPFCYDPPKPTPTITPYPTVIPTPRVTATPYPTATPISNLNISCQAIPNPAYVRQNVSFQAYASGGTGAYNFVWSGACQGSGSQCSNSFANQGTYYAYATVTSGYQNKTVSCPVNVNNFVTPTPIPTPTATVIYTPTPTATPILNVSCYAERSPINSADTARFIANVSGGTGSYSYNWTGDCSSSSSTCSRQLFTAGTYTTYLTVYSNGQSRTANCSVGVASVSDLAVSCQAYPNPVNVGQLVNFNSSVSGGQGNYFYQWTGACSGSSSSCAKTFSVPGNYYSTLTVSSGSQTKSAFCPVSVVAKTPVCKNECSYAGQTRCLSSGYKQVCGNYDSDPCLEWSLSYYSSTCKKPVPTPTPVYKVKKCYDGDVYWFDSYGQKKDLAESCNDNDFKTKDYCCAGKCYHDGLKPSDCEEDCNGSVGNGNNNAPATGLMVSALVRESSDSEWKEQVEIESGKEADMMVIVANGASRKISNVFIKGEFPSDVDYSGNLYIDTGNQSGDFQNGINLGEMEPGAVKTITFRIKTASRPDNDSNEVKVLAQSEIGQAGDSVRIENDRPGLASLAAVFEGIGRIFSSWVMWFILFVILLVIFAARVLSDFLYRRRRFNEPVL